MVSLIDRCKLVHALMVSESWNGEMVIGWIHWQLQQFCYLINFPRIEKVLLRILFITIWSGIPRLSTKTCCLLLLAWIMRLWLNFKECSRSYHWGQRKVDHSCWNYFKYQVIIVIWGITLKALTKNPIPEEIYGTLIHSLYVHNNQIFIVAWFSAILVFHVILKVLSFMGKQNMRDGELWPQTSFLASAGDLTLLSDMVIY